MALLKHIFRCALVKKQNITFACYIIINFNQNILIFSNIAIELFKV